MISGRTVAGGPFVVATGDTLGGSVGVVAVEVALAGRLGAGLSGRCVAAPLFTVCAWVIIARAASLLATGRAAAKVWLCVCTAS